METYGGGASLRDDLDILQDTKILVVARDLKHRIAGVTSPAPNHFPGPAGYTINDTGEDSTGFLGHLSTH